MKTIEYQGETWFASSTGLSYFADGQHNTKVRFYTPDSDREVFGRLPGVAPEDFDQAPYEQLAISLRSALTEPNSSDSER